MRQQFHILEFSWITCHHTRNIFPNSHFICIKTICKNRGGIIGTFSSQCYGKVIAFRAYKTLCYVAIDFIQFCNILFCFLPVYDSFSIITIAFNVISRIQPMVEELNFVKIFAEDFGRNHLATAYHLIVNKVIIWGFISSKERIYIIKKQRNLSENSMAITEQAFGNVDMILLDGFNLGLIILFLKVKLNNFFQCICGFAHCRHYQQTFFKSLCFQNQGYIFHTFRIFYRCSSKFVNFH